MDILLVKYTKWKIALWFRVKQTEFYLFLLKECEKAIKTFSLLLNLHVILLVFFHSCWRWLYLGCFLTDLGNLVDDPNAYYLYTYNNSNTL